MADKPEDACDRYILFGGAYLRGWAAFRDGSGPDPGSGPVFGRAEPLRLAWIQGWVAAASEVEHGGTGEASAAILNDIADLAWLASTHQATGDLDEQLRTLINDETRDGY